MLLRCKTNKSYHFVNFLVSKQYRLNVLFITIKNLNKNIHKMHYLKRKVNEFPKRIGLGIILRNFLWTKKQLIFYHSSPPPLIKVLSRLS